MFFFQLANSLVSRFDFECILNVCHMEWINYKWHLLCSFDETVLIEILKVFLSLQLHQLPCICITSFSNWNTKEYFAFKWHLQYPFWTKLTRCLNERRSTRTSCQLSKVHNLVWQLINGVTWTNHPNLAGARKWRRRHSVMFQVLKF